MSRPLPRPSPGAPGSTSGAPGPSRRDAARDRTREPEPHEAIVRPAYRWECHCRRPAVLLATYDLEGHVNIKIRDRYWHIEGRVATICPKCGRQHVLDLALDPEFVKTLPGPWQPGT